MCICIQVYHPYTSSYIPYRSCIRYRLLDLTSTDLKISPLSLLQLLLLPLLLLFHHALQLREEHHGPHTHQS